MIAANIHAFLRVGGAPHERIRVGPFLIRVAAGSNHPMLNYAVPDDDARPSRTEVEALVAAFLRRDLLPRLEYVSGESPALERILLAAGFSTEAHLPIMTCRPGEERAIQPPPDVDVVLVSTTEDHSDAIAVANEAYGEPAERPDSRMIESRKRGVRKGGAVVLARHVPSMAPVGSGLFAVPCEGVTELAAIGTSAEFRQKGVAAAVTSRLVMRAFETGVRLIWLTPEHPEGERIYARTGFSRSDDYMVHISKSSR